MSREMGPWAGVSEERQMNAFSPALQCRNSNLMMMWVSKAGLLDSQAYGIYESGIRSPDF